MMTMHAPPRVLQMLEQYVDVNVALDRLKELKRQQDLQRQQQLQYEKQLRDAAKEMRQALTPFYALHPDFVYVSPFGKVEAVILEKEVPPTAEEVRECAKRSMARLIHDARQRRGQVGHQDIQQRADDMVEEVWDDEKRTEQTVSIRFTRKRPRKPRKPRKGDGATRNASRSRSHPPPAPEAEEEDEEEEEQEQALQQAQEAFEEPEVEEAKAEEEEEQAAPRRPVRAQNVAAPPPRRGRVPKSAHQTRTWANVIHDS